MPSHSTAIAGGFKAVDPRLGRVLKMPSDLRKQMVGVTGFEPVTSSV